MLEPAGDLPHRRVVGGLQRENTAQHQEYLLKKLSKPVIIRSIHGAPLPESLVLERNLARVVGQRGRRRALMNRCSSRFSVR